MDQEFVFRPFKSGTPKKNVSNFNPDKQPHIESKKKNNIYYTKNRITNQRERHESFNLPRSIEEVKGEYN